MSARERVLRFAEENHNNLVDPWTDPETGFFVDDWKAHLSGLLNAYAHELAERIQDAMEEARAADWGRSSRSKRPYLQGMERAKKALLKEVLNSDVQHP